jgi:hypothetical protein
MRQVRRRDTALGGDEDGKQKSFEAREIGMWSTPSRAGPAGNRYVIDGRRSELQGPLGNLRRVVRPVGKNPPSVIYESEPRALVQHFGHATDEGTEVGGTSQVTENIQHCRP